MESKAACDFWVNAEDKLRHILSLRYDTTELFIYLDQLIEERGYDHERHFNDEQMSIDVNNLVDKHQLKHSYVNNNTIQYHKNCLYEWLKDARDNYRHSGLCYRGYIPEDAFDGTNKVTFYSDIYTNYYRLIGCTVDYD